MDRHHHLLLNEELTILNINMFYIEISNFIEYSIFAVVIIFVECKLFINTGDIYVGIVRVDSILITRNVVIDRYVKKLIGGGNDACCEIFATNSTGQHSETCLQRQRWHITVFRLESQVRTMKHNAISSGYMANLLTGHVLGWSASAISVYERCRIFYFNINDLNHGCFFCSG
ncbi:hypothetical protein RHA35_000445 [Salmonella enterica]|nr:hypothetical protein [Salmonella enterica]ELB8708525.1 hypothetical protein [Salmonella enterica]